MPAMESRIHAPSLYCPSLLQRTARAVNWTVLSSRRARILMSASPACWRAAWTSSTVSTSERLMWVMMSPSFRPQSRAGAERPWSEATSEKPTTITPSENSFTPTARPTGTRVRGCSAARAGGARARAVTASAAARATTHGLAFCSSFTFPASPFQRSYFCANGAVLNMTRFSPHAAGNETHRWLPKCPIPAPGGAAGIYAGTFFRSSRFLNGRLPGT